MKQSLKICLLVSLIGLSACSEYKSELLAEHMLSESVMNTVRLEDSLNSVRENFQIECSFNPENWGDDCNERFCALNGGNCPSDFMAGAK